MLSNKSKYALKALLFLAAKHESGHGPVLISELAKKEKIPQKFLEFILLGLKNKGILSSKKGKGGGYFLNRSPERITFGEIIRALDGPIAAVPCASQTSYRKCDDCIDEKTCGIRMVMKEARDATSKVLDGITLADALKRVENAIEKEKGILTYQI